MIDESKIIKQAVENARKSKHRWDLEKCMHEVLQIYKIEISKVISNLDFWTLFVPDKDEERDMIDRDDLKLELGI